MQQSVSPQQNGLKYDRHMYSHNFEENVKKVKESIIGSLMQSRKINKFCCGNQF